MEPAERSSSSKSSQSNYIPSNTITSDHSSRGATHSSAIGRQPNKMEPGCKHGRQPPSKTDGPADINLGAVQHNPSSMANTWTWDHIEDKDTKTPHHQNISGPRSPAVHNVPEITESSRMQQARNAEIDSAMATIHLRDGIPRWKWTALVVGNSILSFVHGYDVSNVANIQPSIYKAFGGLGALPWVALSYSVSSIAFIPISNKALKFGTFKLFCLMSIMWMISGAAISGAAPAFEFVVLGRVLSALGTSVIYQATLSFYLMLYQGRDLIVVIITLAACFITGLVLGPVIGGTFAGTEQITWRWAFMLVVPLCFISLLLQALFLPCLHIMNPELRIPDKKALDTLGMALHMIVCFLFPFSCILLGSAGVFGARDAIAAWSAFTFALLVYVFQQAYSIGTTPDDRIVSPFSLFADRTIMLTWICTVCAAAAYGAALYYLPIYYAFNQGLGPLDAATRMLPLICIFIFAVVMCNALLVACRFYKPFYMVGSIILIVGGGLFQTLSIETSQSSVIGFESLVAAGLGMLWQLAIPVCADSLHNKKDRLDFVLLGNMAQWGGIAVSLSIAGMVYQGIGLQSLKESFRNGNVGSSFSDDEILELLAGVDAPIRSIQNATVIRHMVKSATTEGIRGCFTIILAAGIISFLAAMGMKWEPIDREYGREQDSEGLELGSHP